MKLRIHVLPGRDVFNITIGEENCQVQTVKEKLKQLTSIDETRLRLFYCGDELQETKRLSDYSIADDALIRLVIAPHTKYSQVSPTQNERPRVSEVLPNRGTVHGGQKVKISGLNFPNSFGWVVSFGRYIFVLLN